MVPQPFHDILDIPPEERHLPDGMTIYDILEMPAMSEANMRRIAFSKVRPSHIPDQSADFIELTAKEQYLRVFKRKENQYVRACQSVSGWVQLTNGITVENEQVEVSSGQFFWETSCMEDGQRCHGFPTPSTATDAAYSKCITLKSWVIAWARVKDETDYRWRHIALATCCACAVNDTS
ncbi:uncharacterized protein [Diadema antillarum]|uniref:uncharacterized protein n=1 Tax=Diadema antillarum TaxID=105358 RepID=UPI003A8ACC0A